MEQYDNKKWIIFCDLDGTLLKDNGISIHPYNVKVVKALCKKGHIFVMMTGRPPRAVKKFYYQLQLNTYMGTYNGAYIYNPCDNSSLGGHIRIPKDVAEKIINEPFIRKYSRSILIESVNNAPLISKLSSYIYEAFHLNSSTMGAILLPKTGKWTLPDNPITIGIETHESINETDYNLVLNKYIDKIIYRQWAKNGLKSIIINITNANANKKDSSKIISEYYGIDQDHTMCFGDGDNDFEIFSWVGHPVKMKKHADDLKPFFHTTKYSNSEAGVGHYLNEFFKLNVTPDK